MDDNNTNFPKKRPLWKIVLAIGVVGVIILTALSIPARLQHLKDSKFCLGSKQKYEASFLGKFSKEPITDIATWDITYITVGIGQDSRTFTTCSINSENSQEFTIRDVTVGDTISKQRYSNEFSIINQGNEYIFLIDKNAPELPSFD